MDPQVERYLDAQEAVWLRRGDSRDVAAMRRDQARQDIEAERRRLLQRGITDDVVGSAIRWHLSNYPYVNLSGASGVSLQRLQERDFEQAAHEIGSRFPIQRHSLLQDVVWRPDSDATSGDDRSASLESPIAAVLPPSLAAALDWLRHQEGIGNLAGIAAGVVQEADPSILVEDLARGLRNEVRAELRRPHDAGRSLARSLWSPVFSLQELGRLQLTNPAAGRLLFARIVWQPLLDIAEDIQKAKIAAETGEPYESSRRIIVATAKTMRLILALEGLVASIRAMPAAVERKIDEIRVIGRQLTADFRTMRRRYFPNLVEMTDEEFARWLEHQQGSVNIGRPQRPRGASVRATDDPSRGLTTERQARPNTVTNRSGSSPVPETAWEPTGSGRSTRDRAGLRPAEVEFIDARGRSNPPPLREGRQFSTRNLRDQHGDRFTWTPETEGGAIVEVTMRYEPVQIVPRAPRHEPTSAAGRQAREATVATEGVVKFDAAHVRAAVMDGIAEAITSFPQLRAINRGAWSKVEARINRLLESMKEMAGRGELVDPRLYMNIKFRYASLRTRIPEDFVVSIRVPGQPTVRLRVGNDPIELRVSPNARTGYSIEAWDIHAHPRELYGKAGIVRLRRSASRSSE